MTKISVCIPAYKNAAFLKRSLDALVSQTFKAVEVILSDDSPDDSVLQIAEEYKPRLNIIYIKNNPAKGTPANWNFTMQQASGKYIKLIHDDDWLAADDALQLYYDCLEANPSIDFCFSAFYNVNLGTGKKEPVFCSTPDLLLLRKNPLNLFKKNFIGPPSGVFQRNNGHILYDEHLKWLVDFEGYIRFLGKKSNFIYLNKCLVNIGLGEEQVTQSTKMVKAVVIPESMYFLQKHGASILKNVWVYDYYWRMFRNLSVKNADDISASGWQYDLPEAIHKMLKFQGRINASVLRAGPLSKMLMLLSYFTNR
jgi:glycosyltransferase involved in cell wall biosynthesis